MRSVAAGVLVAAALTLAAPIQAQNVPVVKTTDVPATVGEVFLKVADQNLSPAERRAAAMALLNVNSRDAQRALASLLHEGVSPTAWRAVAEAVAIHPADPPRELVQPLVSLLVKADASVQPAIAEALGRYNDDEKLFVQLRDMAIKADASPETRRGPILALGQLRTRDAAAHLINLTDIGQADAVQEAAFQALIQMTGLEEYGRDRTVWLDWWSNARKWNNEKWNSRLMNNLTRRDALRRASQQAIEERLLESQRTLYRATTVEDRPYVLAYMLNDQLTAIRMLGIDLSLQRLVDGLPFDEPLRQALRGRLNDEDSTIRRRAALLLRDLGDAPAADEVAARLSRQEEAVVPVLRAYLLLLTRLPREQAVQPLMELLVEPSIRAETAGALAAASEAGLLTKKQNGAVLKQIRKVLENDNSPPAQMATLLGQVGEEQDWERIAKWIDSLDPSMKRAAAAAWADSGRSVQILADRVADPIIEPIAIAAASRRGDDPWTLRALSQHRPTQRQAAEAWENALIAMCGRVAPPVVLETVLRVEPAQSSSALMDRMLTAALERPNQAAPREQLVPLYLKRAELRLASGDATAALADYEEVVAAQEVLAANQRLNHDNRIRMNRGRVQAHLQVGEADEAYTVARELLASQRGNRSPADDPVVDQFIESARDHLESGQPEVARRVTQKLRQLVGSAIKPEVAQRLAIVEGQIIAAGASPSATARRQPRDEEPTLAPNAATADAPTR